MIKLSMYSWKKLEGLLTLSAVALIYFVYESGVVLFNENKYEKPLVKKINKFCMASVDNKEWICWTVIWITSEKNCLCKPNVMVYPCANFPKSSNIWTHSK